MLGRAYQSLTRMGQKEVGIVVSKVVVVVLSTDKEKKGNFKVWYVGLMCLCALVCTLA